MAQPFRDYTNVDEEIVQEVRRFWEVEGCAPTIRDLQAALQVPSQNLIQRRVGRLVERGKLLREPGRMRTIRLPRRYVEMNHMGQQMAQIVQEHGG